MSKISKIAPHFWFATSAEDAAKFYVSIFPDSKLDFATTIPAGPGETVQIVKFTLFGQPFKGMSTAQQQGSFNHAISLFVTCDDQEEVDRYWDALAEGGSIEQCGWLKDKFGLSWQIVPKQLEELSSGPDHEKSGRVMQAMMQMKKIIVADLQKAYDGN